MPQPEFEYDPIKSAWNWWKHGITLADARNLWLDPGKKYVRARSTSSETRYGLIAQHHQKLWFVAFALRSGRCRLISCRAARKKERAFYFDRRI